MPEVRPYYSDKGLTATFYDLTKALDPTLAGDIEIHRTLAPPGGSVLALGVGAGRVAFAVAASLVLDRPPTDLGGVGAIHVFRRD